MPNFDSLLGHYSRSNKLSSIDLVSQRFTQVFRDHGVEISQIPRLFPRIQLADLQDSNRLLAALNPEILDQVAKLFGIRVQWLEGVDDRIYEFRCCDKRPATLLEHLAALVEGKEVWLTFPLRMLCTKKRLDRSGKNLQQLVPILVEKIADLGEETIYRYHIYQDGYDWEHEQCRLELKAIARIIYQRLGTSISMFEISTSDMEEVLEGRLIPKRCFRGALQSNPTLEDFALASSESCVAQEVDELPEVLRYIEEENLNNFAFKNIKRSLDGEVEKRDQSAKQDNWCEVARAIADELDQIDAKCGAHDSKSNIADRVAVEMRKRKIFGPRGPVSANTVLREALGGKPSALSR
jgi:hypothetical protein